MLFQDDINCGKSHNVLDNIIFEATYGTLHVAYTSLIVVRLKRTIALEAMSLFYVCTLA